MSKTVLSSQQDSKTGLSSAILGLRARLANLEPMDWAVIVLIIMGLAIAIYTTSLRHP
jgi:hypothetical protein